MQNTKRSIFRETAVRRYIEGKEQSVLPRSLSPRTFVYLWSLLSLLSVSSLVAWFTKVPVYASGSAVIVQLKDNPDRNTPETVVVAFFPAQHLSSLQTAQSVFLQFDALGDPLRVSRRARFSRSTTMIKPNIYSPDVIHKQFALNAQTSQIVNQPSAIAIVPLLEKNLSSEPQFKSLPVSAYLGSIGRAEVEVRSQRLVSLLPLIGHFFES